MQMFQMLAYICVSLSLLISIVRTKEIAAIHCAKKSK